MNDWVLICHHSLRLLRLALGLVETHGFTRDALAYSVLRLPHPETHSTPLSDAAISSLFGQGTKPEHTLINLFFDDGLEHMKNRAQVLSESEQRVPTVQELLKERLKFNEPVLDHLPDAFASLASSAIKSGPFSLSPVDPLPMLRHALRISDEACYLSGDTSEVCFALVNMCVCVCADLSLELSWYTRRASLAAIYTVAGAVVYFLIATNSINPVIELHQISSPKTANQFLENLLASSSKAKEALDEVNLFASYWYKSTKAIMKSKGIIWHLTWLGYRWSGWRRRNSSMVLKYQRPCSTYAPEDLIFYIHMYNVSTRRVSSLSFSSEIQKKWNAVTVWYHLTSCQIFPCLLSASSEAQRASHEEKLNQRITRE